MTAGASDSGTARFAGKACAVTGAGSGIGRAIAAALAAEGARVAALDLDPAAAAETVAGLDGDHLALGCDVTDPAAVRAALAEAAAPAGGLDVVVANAGVHESRFAADTSIEGIDPRAFDRAVAVNLGGAFLTTKYSIGHLRARGGGAIVLAGSTAAFTGFPLGAAYCASKGGIVQLTKVAATELADDGIRVNCYCPGTIDTPMNSGFLDAVPASERERVKRGSYGGHLNKRLGTPEEVARVALFLASEEASFVTGAAYLVDAGTLAWRGLNA